MTTPNVSIIIPVYNVEQYLVRCVDSALSQTLDDIEIILVDDGSPDASPQICDDYARRFQNVSVIHKQNGGLASARNAGLKIAKGKYIFFLDSDDWLEPDGMEVLFDTAERYQVDLVKYRAIRTGWPGCDANIPCVVEPIRELRDGYYSKQQMMEEIYPKLFATSQLTMGSVVGVWGALYRQSLLRENHISFYEEVKFSEDTIFSANVIKAANSMYFIDKAGVYHYFYNPNSISKSFRSGRWDSCKQLMGLFEKDFGSNKDFDFTQEIHYLKWFCVLLALGEKKYLSSYKKRKKYCSKIVNDSVTKQLPLDFSGMDISFKQKIVMMLIKLRLSSVLARE